jgi:hypothetical protein
LGLELVFLEDKISHTPKRPLMEGEKKDYGTRDPFKRFIEEALMQQRNEMMIVSRKYFGGYQHATHLIRAEMPPHSRYK